MISSKLGDCCYVSSCHEVLLVRVVVCGQCSCCQVVGLLFVVVAVCCLFLLSFCNFLSEEDVK